MRPLAVATVAVPPSRRVTFISGTGWLVTHREQRSVTVLDPGLGDPAHVDVPVAAAPCEPNCHLDRHGVLWVYLPTGDELVAHDAVTGEVIARERLASSVGAAGFWPHPDGKRLGLSVAMGQDTPLSHLAELVDGRIVGRDLPGEFLNGFSSGGDRYLSLPHDIREIALRDVTTGAVTVACHAGEELEAALVSDDFVLVAHNHEGHHLLTTRSLSRQADVDYGTLRNSIAATDGRGRWMTNGRDGVLRLWELPERVVDEAEGQQALW